MLGKAALAAGIAVAAVMAGRTIDLRQLYDQMYPVDTLRRDAFSLCQQSDRTFIRALEDDRESCYRRMPHSFAVALGRVPAASPLAALFAGDQLVPELAPSCAPPLAPADPRGTARVLAALAGRDPAAPAAALAEMGLLPRERGVPAAGGGDPGDIPALPPRRAARCPAPI